MGKLGQVYSESLLLLVLSLEQINAGAAAMFLLTPPLNETILIYFNPPSINNLRVHSQQSIYFNYSKSYLHGIGGNGTGSGDEDWNDTYLFMVFSHDDRIARPLTWDWDPTATPVEEEPQDGKEVKKKYVAMPIELGKEYNFTIKAMHVGRVTLSIALLNMDQEDMVDLPQPNILQALSVSEYKVTTIRGGRPADLIFDSSAAAVAILISFGIGCVTDIDSLKRQLKYPVSLVIGFCCQFILMPVLAFGLAMLLPLGKEEQFGLLCVACVPGGGIGHVATVIGEADIPLSLTMNMISVVAMLGTAPLWIFVLGQYFHRESDLLERGDRIIPIYNFEIWLAATFFAYTFGLVINRFKPTVADALLTWLIKPLLLLATILYITLGVYINMYVFELIDNFAVLGAVLLPVCGCGTGFVLSVICRQKTEFIKTIALETSSLNCLIVLAALRFSLPPHVSDMASTVPMWVMFTIPGLYVVLAVLQTFKRCISNFLESRKLKQGRSYSIASAILTQPGMAALSAPLFVAENENDQSAANEKVTVL